MRETLEQLEALQDLNRRIDQSRRDAEMLGVDVRNMQLALEQRRRRAAQAHEERMTATRQADATELNIKEAEGEIAKLSVQLNSIRNQKEYDAIQHSILSRQADINKWVDEELAALQAADRLTEEETRLADETAQVGAALRELTERVTAQQADLERQATDLTEQKEQIREQVNPNILSAYERLTAHRRARPLARVKGRVCQGCFTRVTKQSENLLMRGEEVVYCHSCGRMLMLDQ